MDINRKAPASASAETAIKASLDIVWSTLTDIKAWSQWNPDVKYTELRGSLTSGTQFRWKAGGFTITSTIQEVKPKQEIAWTGKMPGIRAVHVWRFEEKQTGVLVITEESFDGMLVKCLAWPVRQMLQFSLEKGLNALKFECERASTAPIN
jgi:uncharacterized protein YndB with AHSA1/START domain